MKKRKRLVKPALFIILSLFALFLVGYAIAAVSIPAGIFNSYTTANGVFTNVTNVSSNAALLSYGGSPYDSLVGYWSFDGDNSSTARDLSGQNNNGIYTNGAFVNSSGVYGSAAGFDGVNDYVNCSNSSIYSISNSGLTVSLWTRANSLPPGSCSSRMSIIGKLYDGVSSPWTLSINDYCSGYGKYTISWWNAYGSANRGRQSLAPAIIGSWTHIVFVLNNSNSVTPDIYINGQISNGIDSSSGVSPVYASGIQTLVIGTGILSEKYFNGSIDDVMIFNSSLSAAQVAAIYANTSARFSTNGTLEMPQTVLNSTYDNVTLNVNGYSRPVGSNISAQIAYWNSTYGYGEYDSRLFSGLILYLRLDNNTAIGENATLGVDIMNQTNLTFYSGAGFTTSGKYSSGLAFDGINNYAGINNYNSTKLGSYFTVAYWIKPQVSVLQSLEGPVNFDNTNRIFQAGYDNSTKKINFYVWNASTYSSTSTASALNYGQWYHVVMRYDGNICMFVNGAPDGNCVYLGGPVVQDKIATLEVGRALSGRNLNGSLDEVMIWNRSLSNQEISILANKGRMSWLYTAEQNLSATTSADNSSSNNFTIPVSTTSIYPILKLLSWNNFISPLVWGTITMNASSSDIYAPILTLITPVSGTSIGKTFATLNVSTNDDNLVSTFVDLDNSLVSWWRMDDLNASGGVVDYLGKNNGTVVGGAVQNTSGKFGKSFTFNGTNSVNIANSVSLNMSSSNSSITISLWVNANTFNAVPLEKSGSYQIYLTPNIRFAINNDLTTVFLSSSVITAGQWYNIVAVYNGSMMVYLNGIASGTSVVKSGGISYNTNVLQLARTASSVFNGSIDDVMIFNRSLSQNEITALYANQSSRFLANTYTGLADGSHTAKIYSQDIYGNVANLSTTFTIDNVLPAVNFTSPTPTNNTLYNAATTFAINVSSSDSNLYSSVIVDWNRSLVGWWRFNNEAGENSTFVKDWSSYGNNGTAYSGSSIVQEGNMGSAVSLNGINGYVSLPAGVTQSKNFTGVTYSLWVYPQNSSAGAAGFTRIIDKGWNQEIAITVNLNPTTPSNLGKIGLCFVTNSSSVNTASGSSDGGLNMYRWNLVTVTWSSSTGTGKMYINGLNTKNYTLPGAYLSGAVNSLWLGNDGTGDLFNGSIDDVMIFNRALSQAEISSLYNATATPYINNFSLSAQGPYTYTAYAQDIAGNVNQTEQRTVILDTTAPSGNIFSPILNLITNNVSINFTASLSDGLSGIKNAFLNITHTNNKWLNFDGSTGYVSTGIDANGGVITYDGNYVVHTFTSNGTLNASSSIASAETLVVAGGGGGGNAGGGAGGLVYNNSYYLVNGSYNAIVGTGGAGKTVNGADGDNGGNSTFGSLVAIGGGGAGNSVRNGRNGGSGGGSYTALGGNGTVGQGNNGGNGSGTGAGGGGGGAGTVGGLPSAGTPGIGGNGSAYNISGSLIYYAGGGAGGSTSTASAGGLGGGGNTTINGTANSGGGGGGVFFTGTIGGTGGSGVVIIKYASPVIASSMWIKPTSTNDWEFVAYNGSTFFKNGVVGTPTFYPLNGPSIGINRTGPSYFNGSIDEVRIYNRSLTTTEITQIYRSGLVSNSNLPSSGLVAWYDFNEGSGTTLIDKATGMYNGTITGGAVYTSTQTNFYSFVPGTVTTVIGTVITLTEGIYSWFWNIFDWAGNSVTTTTGNITLDITNPGVNVTGPIAGNNYSVANPQFNISVSDNLAGIGTLIPNLDNSLVSWWRMDDLNASGGVVDYMGRNNGTVVGGAVQNTSGKFGKSMSFNGITGAVETGFVNNLTSNFTVSLWMNGADFTSGAGYRTILTGKNGASYRLGSFYIGWRGGLFGIGRGG
ncbi:MAG: LamG domain-containing protein, partial [archaeon]